MLKIYTNTTDFKISEPTVVAIGKFDGDHKGHQKIFETMRKIKAENGYKAAVFTFLDVHEQQISPTEEKHHLFEEEGMDFCIEYPFNDETKSITAGDFLKSILLDKLNMRHIVAGDDCSFGHNREGNADYLKMYSRIYDYCVTIIDKVKVGDLDISSTYIRELLDEGNVREVAKLLGHPYSISGRVERGNHIGSEILGFPTANIYTFSDKYVPLSGVYAVRVKVGNGTEYSGMSNIGINPTIKEDLYDHRRRIETHIFDFDGVLYDKDISISFIEYIRPDKEFANIEALQKQLIEDELLIRKLV